MSRGSGAMQRRVLGRLAARDVSVSQLCWELAEEAGAIDAGDAAGAGIDSGVIRQSFYSGFLRALKGLKAKDEVTLSARPLTTGDVALVYPYKTLRLEVRELRKLVLPHLLRYSENKGFSRDEVEGRVLMDIEGTEKLRDCQALWSRIEQRLWTMGTDASLRPAVLPLILCGSAYFGESLGVASAGVSLVQHVKAAKPLLPVDLVEDLRVLYGLAFDQQRTDQVVSKGRLFAIADFGRRQGGVELNEEVLHWLADEIPEVIRSLRGFVDADASSSAPDGTEGWVTVRGHSFPVLLRRLIDRRIFEEHQFVSAA